jgi:hypothetical protein
LLENFHDASKTFEAAGADFARSFAIDRKLSEDRAESIQRGIAHHTTLGARGDPVNVAMIRIGAGLDVFGFDCEKITSEARKAILENFPRLAFKQAFRVSLAAYKQRHPGPAGERDWIAGFLLDQDNDRCWTE